MRILTDWAIAGTLIQAGLAFRPHQQQNPLQSLIDEAQHQADDPSFLDNSEEQQSLASIIEAKDDQVKAYLKAMDLSLDPRNLTSDEATLDLLMFPEDKPTEEEKEVEELQESTVGFSTLAQVEKNELNGDHLTQDEARTRASMISNVTYEVTLGLPKTKADDQAMSYFGQFAATFLLSKPSSQQDLNSLFLDFNGKQISNVVVNGQALSDKEGSALFVSGRVQLPLQVLNFPEKQEKAAANSIQFSFLNSYRRDGVGLHSYHDPSDSSQYLFSQFEPTYAHYVFPNFDQPDLKAKWTFSAVLPEDWTAITNELVEAEFDPKKKEAIQAVAQVKQIAASFGQQPDLGSSPYKLMKFLKSAKISTYLYAVVAGPYKFVEYKPQAAEQKFLAQSHIPPMRIYARKSVLSSVNATEMFAVTVAGLKYYTDLFGRPYPFRKYDQVFVPEHNAGGMENVGCVTYNEKILFRGENPTLNQRMRSHIVTLHELAHMWFGNLVTMKWWNDIWLNEAFATFMAFQSMTSAPELKYFEAPWTFFLEAKMKGVSADTLSTTHPICNNVKVASDSEALFDGISYGKGASFLKQVNSVLGRDGMKSALKEYFSKYEWGNTELQDFVGTLQRAYSAKETKEMGEDFNIQAWGDSWLTTSGINSLQAVPEFGEGGKLKSLAVKQGFDQLGSNRLRKHKISIALYDDKWQPQILKGVVVGDQRELTQVDISGVDFPVKAVVVNPDDMTYAKIWFDLATLRSFQKELFKIEDPLTRSMIWNFVYYHVIDVRLSSVDYFDLAVNQMVHETNEISVLVTLKNLKSLVSFFLPVEISEQSTVKLFDALYTMVQKEMSHDLKQEIVGKMFDFLLSDKHMKQAVEWLEKGHITRPDSGESVFQLQPSHSQTLLKVIYRSAQIPTEKKAALMQKVVGNDSSDMAHLTKLTCFASLPDPLVKEKVWKDLVNGTDKSLHERKALLDGFFNSWDQHSLVKPYFSRFYEVVGDVVRNNQFKYSKSFFFQMLPRMNDIKEADIDLLKKVKEQSISHQEEDHPSTQNLHHGPEQKGGIEAMLQNLVQDGIEMLQKSKTLREFAAHKP